jgi:hypothetical protein
VIVIHFFRLHAKCGFWKLELIRGGAAIQTIDGCGGATVGLAKGVEAKAQSKVDPNSESYKSLSFFE